MFGEGLYPESWGKGIKVPVLKGVYSEEANNFRSITLNNIVAKVYSTQPSDRIVLWSRENSTIIDNQYGFQEGKSTVDCIFIFLSIIT